jgi:predicted PurR-regulated permease PerM
MYPTPFQKKILWLAITALSFVAIGWVVATVGGIVFGAISFLQPVLIPVAVAAILAFLLEPVVGWLMRFRLSRLWSIIAVYFAAAALFVGILVWVVPSAYRQGSTLIVNFPSYTKKAQDLATRTMGSVDKMFQEIPLLKSATHPGEEAPDQFTAIASKTINDSLVWLQQKLPDLAVESGKFLQRSVGGFLGVFGILLSMILVPIFLFFFLKESQAIRQNWANYLPLRASPVKSEIVALLSEINAYLISFFRGQLIVSMIDGAMIAAALLVLRLEFAVLIGLMVAILGLVPYLGMMICWIPAVIIAAAQFGDWVHPFWVTVIFIVANQIDGIFIAPKIVGESVGLHPLTVILSVLAWSLVLGGLLGALLAVPLTATLKVLLKRYFWDRPGTTLGASADPPPATS